jgi:hypothetical protein
VIVVVSFEFDATSRKVVDAEVVETYTSPKSEGAV